MSDPICDITEVTLSGDVDVFSTIGQIADVTAECDVIPWAIYGTRVEVTAAGAVSQWDKTRTLVNVVAAMSVTTIDCLTASNFVNVSAIGSVRAFQVLRDLAEVSGAGDVTIFQPPIRDVVNAIAQAAVQAIQTRRAYSLAQVSAKGSATITNARSVRQIVDVSAAAAVSAFQTLLARNFVEVTATGSVSLVGDMARLRELIEVTANANVQAFQHLLAHDVAAVEACTDVEIVDPVAGGAAWTAATESLGMSRYTLPFGLISLAAMGDAMLAIGPDGAYLLNADDDAGAPITATMRGALSDTGDSTLKHPLALYIAYTSTLPVKVSVGETSTGEEVTWDYTGPAFAQTAPRPIRIPTGRGIRTRYVRFTISNTGGAPMTVFAAEHDYIQTSRRT